NLRALGRPIDLSRAPQYVACHPVHAFDGDTQHPVGRTVGWPQNADHGVFVAMLSLRVELQPMVCVDMIACLDSEFLRDIASHQRLAGIHVEKTAPGLDLESAP